MKRILPGKASGVCPKELSRSLILSQSCNVVNPGKIFHSNSADSPLMSSKSLFPHTQIRIILSHDERRDIPNLEFSTIHVSIRLSQIAFPMIVLLKDDHTDFVQEERQGLPYWTMILAICVVVDESKCLDTPILEFSTICEHLPFSLGCKLILRLLLVHRNLAIWR